jgi:hypothetical protein
MKDLIERFTEKIEEPSDVHNDCWEWTTEGYGHFWLNRRCLKAHRVSYELFVEPIPEGFEIEHLCRNRACVRPDHLEAVPPHCPAGHPYDEQNTYYWTNPRTGYTARYCRACHAKLTLAAYHRRKER